MIDLSLQQLVSRFVAYVFIAGLHGLAVAAVAVALGDHGPRHDGRLRVNPMAHLDVIGTACGVLSSVGWIRPIAIDPAELRSGRAGLVIVVLAGIAATLAGAVALRLVRPLLLPLLPDTPSATLFALIEIVGQLSVWFALFNLLPLPPLTGAHLLVAVGPGWGKTMVGFETYAGVALAVVAVTGVFTKVLGPGYRFLAGLLLGE